MNTYTVTLTIKTYSEDPEDWIIDSISDQLEDDETIESITITQTN